MVSSKSSASSSKTFRLGEQRREGRRPFIGAAELRFHFSERGDGGIGGGQRALQQFGDAQLVPAPHVLGDVRFRAPLQSGSEGGDAPFPLEEGDESIEGIAVLGSELQDFFPCDDGSVRFTNARGEIRYLPQVNDPCFARLQCGQMLEDVETLAVPPYVGEERLGFLRRSDRGGQGALDGGNGQHAQKQLDGPFAMAEGVPFEGGGPA